MQSRSRFLKAFDLFGLFIAVLVALTWMYGLQFRNWYRAREEKKTHPSLSLIPRPLPGGGETNEKQTTLTEFGYQIDVPWPTVGTRRLETTTAYLFAGGRGLTWWNPEKLKSTLQLMRNAVEQTNRPFHDFLGARTEYDLLRSEFNTTPDQLSPFLSKSEAYRRGMLLDLKGVELLRGPAAIYSFQSNELRGFQLGDPAKDRRIEIRAFDTNDREVWLMLGADPHSNVTLDQSEISGLERSLRLARGSEGENGSGER